MPRQPRLDAPEVLHHVMLRGIERTSLFRDNRDCADFVARLAGLAAQGALTVYAWALLPTHAHLLLRTGTRPLPRSMRALLTGGGRRPAVSQARPGIAYPWMGRLGHPGPPLAAVLGVHPAVIYQAARRGAAAAARWDPLLDRRRKTT